MATYSEALQHLDEAIKTVYDTDARVQAVGITEDGRGNHYFAAFRNASLAVPFRAGPGPAQNVQNIPVSYHDSFTDTAPLHKVPVSGAGAPLASSVIRERSPQRPLVCGLQIQNFDDDVRQGVFAGGYIIIGTLGCFVRLGDGRPALLSNNHVVAGENRGMRNQDRITQPGGVALGPNDIIATLTDYIDLKSSPPGARPRQGNVVFNTVDAGVAALEDHSPASFGQRYLPGRPVRLSGTAPVAKGDKVFKVGRTTGLTHGEVVATNTTVGPIQYGPDNAPLYVWFKDCLTIRGLDGTTFSDHGDSGSAIVRADTHQVTGLLFAGDDTVTYACPIASVLSELRLTFI